MKLLEISIVMMFFTSCTLSFTNISTHGTATDLVDEEQTTSPDVKPNISIPNIP